MPKAVILGSTGCTRCRMLELNIQKAARQCGIDIRVEKSRRADDYRKYKVGLVPALIIDDRVISSGRVPSVDELIGLFENHFRPEQS
jgi:hypothetical protein